MDAYFIPQPQKWIAVAHGCYKQVLTPYFKNIQLRRVIVGISNLTYIIVLMWNILFL